MDAEGEAERLRRWRLVLGGAAEEGLGGIALGGADLKMDTALGGLYDAENGRGGLGASSPGVARWLGDIREYFPVSTVQVMQRDAVERLGLHELLLEPELLEAVEPDVELVATLLSLSRVVPERTKETARQVVRRVVEDLERRLASRLVQSVRGSLQRATRTRRPRQQDIDWDRTIRRNLQHYSPVHGAIVAERLVGHARGRSQGALQDIVLCVDQSGSMATSVVYSGVFAAALASLRSVRTRLVVFDTSVVDLTAQLADPVDVLFGAQLGGGTEIDRALLYCQGLVERPTETVMVLITDLYEGGDARRMLRVAAELVGSGVRMITLLALTDRGAPSYHQQHAAALAAHGVPVFACTPDRFPDLMAAAIARQDIEMWAAREGIVTARAEGT